MLKADETDVGEETEDAHGSEDKRPRRDKPTIRASAEHGTRARQRRRLNARRSADDTDVRRERTGRRPLTPARRRADETDVGSERALRGRLTPACRRGDEMYVGGEHARRRRRTPARRRADDRTSAEDLTSTPSLNRQRAKGASLCTSPCGRRADETYVAGVNRAVPRLTTTSRTLTPVTSNRTTRPLDRRRRKGARSTRYPLVGGQAGWMLLERPCCTVTSRRRRIYGRRERSETPSRTVRSCSGRRERGRSLHQRPSRMRAD